MRSLRRYEISSNKQRTVFFSMSNAIAARQSDEVFISGHTLYMYGAYHTLIIVRFSDGKIQISYAHTSISIGTCTFILFESLAALMRTLNIRGI